jgi:hypothetical protein
LPVGQYEPPAEPMGRQFDDEQAQSRAFRALASTTERATNAYRVAFKSASPASGAAELPLTHKKNHEQQRSTTQLRAT